MGEGWHVSDGASGGLWIAGSCFSGAVLFCYLHRGQVGVIGWTM